MNEPIVAVVVAVVVIAVVTAVARRLNLAGPLILVVIGLGVSLLPFVEIPEIDPDLILVGVLPPLLYSAAVGMPAIEFRRDFSPIAGLSVLLVFLSAIALGFFFDAMIPELGIFLAIALGAILSPTDAVATSIVKRLGISPRVTTLLEGESLLNDATSLVILRSMLIAVAAGAVQPGALVGSFLLGVLVAIVVGAVVGYVNLRLRAWVGTPAANTAIGLVVPFAAYVPTEHLDGSGLVAAVVAGIVTGQGAARWFTPEQRMSDVLNWRTIELVLEGGVFLVMGLELEGIVDANLSEHEGLWHGTWLALVALAIIVGVRAVYVTVLVWAQSRRARDKLRRRIERFGDRLDDLSRGSADDAREPAPLPRRLESGRTRVRRALADLDYYQASPLGWRHGAVIVWAGMRGVVTLAAAQTLPQGDDNPERALLVFVAFLVALVSLLLQGTTLPLLVRWLGLAGTGDVTASREEQARLTGELNGAAVAALSGDALRKRDGTTFEADLVARIGSRLAEPPDDDETAAFRDGLELRLALIQVMRDRLDALSHDGTFSTAALRRALAELDADQLNVELRLDDDR
ncbi:MAG: cation:proton antiporter [Microbacterium sp.]